MFQGKFVFKKPNRRVKLLSCLVLGTLLSSLCSVYLQEYSITLSLESLFLLLTGFFFGPIVGFINGFVVDLITFSFSSAAASYSFLYTLQPAVIGFIGGLGRYLNLYSVQLLKELLFVSTFFFSLLYFYIYMDTFYIVLMFPLAYYLILRFTKFWINRKLVYIILIIFSLSTYIASFWLGMWGTHSISTTYPNSHFLARGVKELIKLLTLAPVFCLCVYKIK